MKIAIGLMGSSSITDPTIERNAFLIGEYVAKAGAVLITGATTGLPFAGARGATQAGGEVIGFSPAFSAQEHQRSGLPVTDHDLLIYTGLTSKGRNLLNVRASHALVFVGGSMGALNEFTIAYDEQKIIGVLEGSGGFCDHMRDWIQVLAKPGNRAVLHYDSDPTKLMSRIFQSIRETFNTE
jgi:uncharacterized protein (TIGR00725 family)